MTGYHGNEVGTVRAADAASCGVGSIGRQYGLPCAADGVSAGIRRRDRSDQAELD